MKRQTALCLGERKKQTATLFLVVLNAERICEVKQMDELLQNIQDSTDEIASMIRLAIWVQIMLENTLEVEDDTD